MEGFIPTGGGGGTGLIQQATGAAGNAVGSVTATFASTPIAGNTLIAKLTRRGTGSVGLTPAGWTKHDVDVSSAAFDGGRSAFYYRTAGVAEPTNHTFTSTDVKRLVIQEWPPLTAIAASGTGWIENSNQAAASTMTSGSITPPAVPLVIFAAFVQAARTPSIALQSPWSEDYDNDVDPSGPSVVFGHRIVALGSGSYQAQAISSHVKGYGSFLAAFEAGAGGITWVSAPDTVDAADGTSDDVDGVAISAASGAFWRGDRGVTENVGTLRAVLGMENAGDVTILVQGGDESDFSDAATVVQLVYEATGSYTADDLDVTWDGSEHRYWRLVLDTAAQGVRVFEVEFETVAVIVPNEPGKAILEIYVHDEDASRWGEATWATGPATGTEGIWSAAGWQDVTPQGVWAHIIWGSRRPDRGILAEQDPASWTIETYDPDRILDPGNPDSPYAPQLLAGVPIRISHNNVIRTAQIDDWQYNYKPPAYRGRILASDTIATLYRAYTPADSILGDTLMERIQDAINAAGIAVGGIPLPPGGPSGPALSEWVEGAATDDDNRVWDIIRKAGEEALYVIFVTADAGLGMRPWGSPLDRGREISAPNLEDLASRTSEDGVFSVVKVQVADPDLDPIIRAAAPLPRYGRRVYERTETTEDPEGWAAAVLQDRAWQGVQYVPGAVHCFTADDVDYFGSMEIMERVTITHPGVVSVQGRILGGELWVEHRKDEERGATWIFQFQVATDGSTAIGLTTLVSDQGGEPLLDDMTETDFLEAD